MAFRFALQSVLRLRASFERQEELRLFARAAAVVRLRTELEILEVEHLRRKRVFLRELKDGSSGAALQFSTVCDAAYAHIQRNLRVQIEAAEKQRLLQLREYRVARQKREILEGLRERQQAAFDLNSDRREQQSVDEAFLLRFYREACE
jgi:flagellar export protein FliJ